MWYYHFPQPCEAPDSVALCQVSKLAATYAVCCVPIVSPSQASLQWVKKLEAALNWQGLALPPFVPHCHSS